MGSIEAIGPAPRTRATVRRNERSQVAWKVVIYLSALMLGVTALSVFVLSRQSLRLDEAQSLWQTSHSPSQIFWIVAQDVHVPLYHQLLHWWMVVFGGDIATARYLSLVFFLATIPAMYLLARLIMGRVEAGLVAALVALSPFMNWYGNEARMYAQLMFFTVLSEYFFLRIFQKRRGHNWWWYTATAVLGMYTHYFFALVLLTQGAFYLLRRRDFVAGTGLRLMAVGAIVLAAVAPWLWYVSHLGTANNTKPLLNRPSSGDLVDTFSQFLFGFQDEQLNTLIISMWPLTVLLALASLQRHRRVRVESGYMVLATLLPILLVFVASVSVRPLYLTRYLIVALPSLYLLLVWVTQMKSQRLSWALRGTLVAVMAITLVHEVTSRNTPVKEDYHAATNYIEAHAQPTDVIAVSAPFTIYPVEYYYDGPLQIQTLPIWDRTVTGAVPSYSATELPKDLDTIKGRHANLWLIMSYDQGYEKNIKDYMNSHYEQLRAVTLSPKLTLYEYKLRYDLPNTAAILKSLNAQPDPLPQR
jgi:mannosyltransferase